MDRAVIPAPLRRGSTPGAARGSPSGRARWSRTPIRRSRPSSGDSARPRSSGAQACAWHPYTAARHRLNRPSRSPCPRRAHRPPFSRRPPFPHRPGFSTSPAGLPNARPASRRAAATRPTSATSLVVEDGQGPAARGGTGRHHARPGHADPAGGRGAVRSANEIRVPAAQITDAPRYAWRGLSLDVARTFYPVAEIRRVIDLLELYKLNVLHLHLTDDEAWRARPGPPGRRPESGAPFYRDEDLTGPGRLRCGPLRHDRPRDRHARAHLPRCWGCGRT